jgi:hypothetical protein
MFLKHDFTFYGKDVAKTAIYFLFKQMWFSERQFYKTEATVVIYFNFTTPQDILTRMGHNPQVHRLKTTGLEEDQSLSGLAL